MLAGLAAIPLLVVAYIRLQRQRPTRAVVLADVYLQRHLFPSPSTFRRHLPAVFYLLALTALLFGLGRPLAVIPLPVNRAVIILAVDVSKSMIGEDVKPNRLKATQAAVLDLLAAVPPTAKVGLVSFSDYAQVLVPPSTDRIALKEAVAGLHLQQATGIGTAIIEILKILPGRKDVLADKFDTLPPGLVPRGVPPTVPAPQPSPTPPVSATELPPAAIIIFSDGVSNIGMEPIKAAALAKEAKVKIYGVGVGTPSGSVMQIEGQLVLVPFDATLLQQMAQLTEGQYFEISASTELREVYRKLGRVIGWEARRTELAPMLAGSAGLFLLVGATLSLAWFRRIP
jgi:Ca-activated chloride channel family protein